MRVLILGGDGFCGWPTSLHLSACGHDVRIVDNFARRCADVELEAQSLTPIEPLGTRLRVWEQLSGARIGFDRLDVAVDFAGVVGVLGEWRAGGGGDFAGQRGGP